MYAIVDTSGKQYRVEPGARITVDRMAADVGATVTLDRVLLIGGDAEPKVGTPTVPGAKVTATVVDHHLGDKQITFKYMRTRRFRRRVGYRHSHTTLEIVAIG
jgi:large subunit ribosomal protein L21